MHTLIYWPSLQGRGEFVRLLLEDAGIAYSDLARLPEDEGGGFGAVREHLYGGGSPMPGFAPPFLIDGGFKLAQMPAICAYLSEKHDLIANDVGLRSRALQLQLTIADVVSEVHDTHHPLGTSQYYEDQKREAAVRSEVFRKQRLGKLLGYFEKVLAQSGGAFLLGENPHYPDLGLYQITEGLRYAFPIAANEVLQACPGILSLVAKLSERPSLGAYLASERRIPFNTDGIFRAYAELDGPAS